MTLPLTAARCSTLALALWTACVAGAAPATPPSPPAVDHGAFETAVRQAVAPQAGQAVVGLKVLHLSGDIGPWLDTGLALLPGDRVMLLKSGRVWWSRAHALSLEAPMAVWGRIGDQGLIFRGERTTDTVTADRAGTLQLKLYPGLRWLDERGRYAGEPAAANPDAGGGVSVALIQWRAGVHIESELKRLTSHPTLGPLAAAEVDRLGGGTAPAPDGWHYLWELGPAEIFTEVEHPSGHGHPPRAIRLHTRNDVGILQKDAPFELTPNTVLRWRWKAEQLPARAPENQVPTHDYMSIAVEFDDGRDITFLWSHSLPVGEIFACPLPAWKDRETHVVARSGSADLGRWLDESVNLHALYRQAIGDQLPARVTRVWLIGVSLFGHGEGRSEFGQIVLQDGARRLEVY